MRKDEDQSSDNDSFWGRRLSVTELHKAAYRSRETSFGEEYDEEDDDDADCFF